MNFFKKKKKKKKKNIIGNFLISLSTKPLIIEFEFVQFGFSRRGTHQLGLLLLPIFLFQNKKDREILSFSLSL